MATLNLGRLKPVFRGSWNNATAYNIDDIVVRNNQSYISIQAGTNQDPATATAYWTLMAAAGTDLGATLNNNEIAFKTNAGVLDGIPIGTANQILEVNSGATGYQFTAKPEGKVKQLIHAYNTSTLSINTSVNSFTDVSGISLTITPTSASSKILLQGQFNFRSHDQYCYQRIVRRVGGSDAIPTGWVGAASGSRIQSQFGNMYRYLGADDANTNGNVAFSFCDADHNTTSAITYALQFRFSTGSYYAAWGNSHTASNNNTSGRAPRFNWTAMEIV